MEQDTCTKCGTCYQICKFEAVTIK
ncbi:MAG: 4Fe-4S binding protein [Thermodesulfobacteriota bacterium]|nr:4Fe-4S binding protein [Thermodesulfobacteriota bacterium]